MWLWNPNYYLIHCLFQPKVENAAADLLTVLKMINFPQSFLIIPFARGAVQSTIYNFMPTDHLVKAHIRMAHFSGFFLQVSPSQIINPENSMTLWRLKTVKSSLFHVWFFPLQLLHWYWKGVWLCTLIKGRHFILNWALIQSSSPLWIIGPKKCVSIPEKSLWVLSVYETLKPELEVKENVVIALQNYSFNCLVSILYKFTVLLKYPSSWKGLVESGL